MINMASQHEALTIEQNEGGSHRARSPQACLDILRDRLALLCIEQRRAKRVDVAVEVLHQTVNLGTFF